MTTSVEQVHRASAELAQRWREGRPVRQERRHLDPDDFAELRAAGFLGTVVPRDHGGLWRDMAHSTRGVCGILRTLARADPSVALVAAMHPAVVGFWLVNPDPAQPTWEVQREAVFATAMAGRQWGTITSEPGSGGDIARTTAPAVPCGGSGFITGELDLLSGDKHFGSGSGIVDHMMTSGLRAGDDEPAMYAIDVRDRPWERDGPMSLVAEWDGAGMAATQSHAMRFEEMPAVRAAWARPLAELGLRAGTFANCLFTAVVLGVLDEAVGAARERFTTKVTDGAEIRAFEQTEWTRAEMDHWLATQAFEGALRAVEAGDPIVALHASLRAKQSVAELAEATMLRLTRALGGGTFSLRSPFAHWFSDVRALGFLRPPWGFAYDALFATSLPDAVPPADDGQ